MDHCQAARNAAILVFGTSVLIISCWVHVIRKCHERKSKLLNKLYWNTIQEHITIMHMCSCSSQFMRISKIYLREWRLLGEEEYSNWFTNTYLDPKWMNWFFGAPGQKLVNVDNNSLESYNRQIKLIIGTTIRQSLERFIDQGIRDILLDGSNRVQKSLTSISYLDLPQSELIKEKAIPSEMLQKSILFLSSPQSYSHILTMGKWFFNTKKTCIFL
jgi:hypothetical protein